MTAITLLIIAVILLISTVILLVIPLMIAVMILFLLTITAVHPVAQLKMFVHLIAVKFH